MSPELIVITTREEVLNLYNYLLDKDFVAYDTEATGLTKRHEIIGISICAEETKAYYIIIAFWHKELNQLIYLDTKHEIAPLLYLLKTKRLLMHNGVYDCMMTTSNFEVSLIEALHTDTMILAHLINENRRVGLKELSITELGLKDNLEQDEMKASIIANGGSITKGAYHLYKADPYLIGKYGAKDAWLTYMLFMKLVLQLYEQGLDQFFYEDESMPLLRGPTYELNTIGLQIDTQYLSSLKKTLQAECLEAKDFIYQEITPYIKDKYPGTNKKNVFNIGASQQLAWLLFGVLKLEFGTLTDGGKEACKALNMKLPYTAAAKRHFIAQCEQAATTIIQPEATVNGKKVRAKKLKQPWAYIAVDKATLNKLKHRYKWIERLLEYQTKMKLLSTYVEGLEERIQYGVIQPSFLQHGTTSGRYSSRDPNFQNLPRDDKRIKKCVMARPGKVFVGADQSQLEPRVFAYYSGDERLLAAFKDDSDFYSVIGIDVHDKYDCEPQKEGPNAFGELYPKLRHGIKQFALASVYGANAYRLAPMLGMSIDDTQQVLNRYFERFHGVAKMMQDAHKTAKETGQVTNIFGRPRRMPEAKRITKMYGNTPHDELPYEARSLLNLAVNHRIQSTGASIVNRGMIKLWQNLKELQIDAKIVCQVHDSVIVECNKEDAETVSLLLQDALENTVQLQGVSFEACPKVGQTLADV